jgi:hypothetical protein
VSVYNRTGTVNVRTAPPVVLQVLLGVDAATATDLATERDGAPAGFLPQVQAQLTAIDPRLASLLVDLPPVTVTIEARGDVSAPRNQSRVALVCDISSEVTEGPRILRWLDRAPWDGSLPGGGPGGEPS